MTIPNPEAYAEALRKPRYIVRKESGSRYAYVTDNSTGRTIKRYDVLRGDGKRNGWVMADRHAADLNAQVKP